MPVVQIVFVAPVYIHIFTFVLMESIHDCDMVSLCVDEFSMGIGCFLQLLLRPEEDIRATHARDNRQHLFNAFIFWGT